MFNTDAQKLFDIFCEDSDVKKIINKKRKKKEIEQMYGVNMTQDEWTFFEDQRQNRQMLCEDFVDKKCAQTMERRRCDI